MSKTFTLTETITSNVAECGFVLSVRVMPMYGSMVGEKRSCVLLELSRDSGKSWCDFAPLDADDARGLARLLENAATVCDLNELRPKAEARGVRMLPTVKLCGQTFFIDDRLRQLRNVENPLHCFDLDFRSA